MSAYASARGVPPSGPFALLYQRSLPLKRFVLGIDPRLLVAVQAWRVIGGMFLVLYAFELLPGLFAYPAGLGDLAVGVSAPFVLRAVIHRTRGWESRVRWLNVAGLVDFASAVGTGILTSNSAIGVLAGPASHASLGELPLSLISCFAVPFWVILHAIALLQLRTPSRVGATFN